jgi:allantoicase
MSQGWETARRRDDGNDWLVARLGAPGTVHHAVLDTAHFIGNCPGAARLSDQDTGVELLERTRLQPSTEHWLRVHPDGPSSSVRLDIYPDGGLSRLRLLGEVDPTVHDELAQRWLGLLPPEVATSVDQAEFFT